MSLRLRSRLHTYPGPEPGSTAPGAGSPSAEKDGPRGRPCSASDLPAAGEGAGTGWKASLFHPGCLVHLGGMARPGDSPQKPSPSHVFSPLRWYRAARGQEQQRPLVLWGFQCIWGQHPPPIRAGFCHGSSSSSSFQTTCFCRIWPSGFVRQAGVCRGTSQRRWGSHQKALISSPSQQTGGAVPFVGARGVIAQPAARARVMGSSIP